MSEVAHAHRSDAWRGVFAAIANSFGVLTALCAAVVGGFIAVIGTFKPNPIGTSAADFEISAKWRAMSSVLE